MSLPKKIVLTFGIVVVLLIGALIAIPYFFKEEIMDLAKVELNKYVNATVDFKDIDLSLLKSFPNLYVSLQDLKVTGKEEFAKIDLIDLGALNVVVNVKTLYNQENIKIKGIELVDATIHAKVLKNGKANWDITLPSDAPPETTPTSTEPVEFNVSLQKYAVKNANIIYDDATLNTKVNIKGLNHEGRGDFTQDVFTLSTNTNIAAFTTIYEGIAYFNKVKTMAKADIEINNTNGKYTFKDNNFKLNALNLGFHGFIQMPPKSNDIVMDFDFNAKESDFKHILSMIPAAYTADFKEVETTGKMAVKGKVKGKYNEKAMPAFNLAIDVNEGTFHYPDLPKSVTHVNTHVKIDNPDGELDNTIVNVSQFAFQLGNDPFEVTALLSKPMSDPVFKTKAKGRIDLSELAKSFPIEGVKKLTGIIQSDLVANGTMSAVEQSKYEELEIDGLLKITNMEYAAVDLPKDLLIRNLDMAFNPENVVVKAFDGKMGKSDFKATGQVENMLSYMLKDGTLKGNMNITANIFDVDEWMVAMETPTEGTTTTPSEPTPTSEEMEVFKVPAKLDMAMTAKADKVIYDGMVLEKATGSLLIKDEKVTMKGVQFNMLDGKIGMDGSYSTKTGNLPKVDMAYDIDNVNMVKAFTTFNTMEKLAPIAKYVKGNFTSKMKMQGQLDKNMMPNLMSFSGDGMMAMFKATLANCDIITELGKKLEIKKLQKIDIVDFTTKFAVEKGRVQVKPFNIEQLGIKMNIGGSHGFDQTLNYDIKAKVPRELLGKQANTFVGTLLDRAKKEGINIELPNYLNVDIKLLGTMTKPEIKLDLKEALANTGQNLLKDAKDLLNEVKDMVVDEAKKVKEEVEKQVKAEVDKAKDAIQAEVDKTKEELQNELKNQLENGLENGGEGLKDYATDKAKEIQEKGIGSVDEVKDKAKDVGKDILTGGGNRADSLKDAAIDKTKDKIKGLFGKKKPK